MYLNGYTVLSRDGCVFYEALGLHHFIWIVIGKNSGSTRVVEQMQVPLQNKLFSLNFLMIRPFCSIVASLPTDHEVLISIPRSALEFFSRRELFEVIYMSIVPLIPRYQCR